MKKIITMLALCMSTYVYADDSSKVSAEITNKINGDKKSIEALAKERQDSIAKIAALKTEIGKLEIYVDIIDKETATIKQNIDNNNKKLVELQNPHFEVLSAPAAPANAPKPSVVKDNMANKDISDTDKKSDASAKEEKEIKETKKPKKRIKKEPKPPSQQHSQDLANMINQISNGNIKKK